MGSDTPTAAHKPDSSFLFIDEQGRQGPTESPRTARSPAPPSHTLLPPADVAMADGLTYRRSRSASSPGTRKRKSATPQHYGCLVESPSEDNQPGRVLSQEDQSPDVQPTLLPPTQVILDTWVCQPTQPLRRQRSSAPGHASSDAQGLQGAQQLGFAVPQIQTHMAVQMQAAAEAEPGAAGAGSSRAANGAAPAAPLLDIQCAIDMASRNASTPVGSPAAQVAAGAADAALSLAGGLRALLGWPAGAAHSNSGAVSADAGPLLGKRSLAEDTYGDDDSFAAVTALLGSQETSHGSLIRRTGALTVATSGNSRRTPTAAAGTSMCTSGGAGQETSPRSTAAAAPDGVRRPSQEGAADPPAVADATRAGPHTKKARGAVAGPVQGNPHMLQYESPARQDANQQQPLGNNTQGLGTAVASAPADAAGALQAWRSLPSSRLLSEGHAQALVSAGVDLLLVEDILTQVESRIRASLQSEVERMTQDALARLTQTPATPTRPQAGRKTPGKKGKDLKTSAARSSLSTARTSPHSTQQTLESAKIVALERRLVQAEAALSARVAVGQLPSAAPTAQASSIQPLTAPTPTSTHSPASPAQQPAAPTPPAQQQPTAPPSTHQVANILSAPMTSSAFEQPKDTEALLEPAAASQPMQAPAGAAAQDADADMACIEAEAAVPAVQHRLESQWEDRSDLGAQALARNAVDIADGPLRGMPQGHAGEGLAVENSQGPESPEGTQTQVHYAPPSTTTQGRTRSTVQVAQAGQAAAAVPADVAMQPACEPAGGQSSGRGMDLMAATAVAMRAAAIAAGTGVPIAVAAADDPAAMEVVTATQAPVSTGAVATAAAQQAPPMQLSVQRGTPAQTPVQQGTPVPAWVEAVHILAAAADQASPRAGTNIPTPPRAGLGDVVMGDQAGQGTHTDVSATPVQCAQEGDVVMGDTAAQGAVVTADVQDMTPDLQALQDAAADALGAGSVHARGVATPCNSTSTSAGSPTAPRSAPVVVEVGSPVSGLLDTRMRSCASDARAALRGGNGAARGPSRLGLLEGSPPHARPSLQALFAAAQQPRVVTVPPPADAAGVPTLPPPPRSQSEDAENNCDAHSNSFAFAGAPLANPTLPITLNTYAQPHPMPNDNRHTPYNSPYQPAWAAAHSGLKPAPPSSAGGQSTPGTHKRDENNTMRGEVGGSTPAGFSPMHGSVGRERVAGAQIALQQPVVTRVVQDSSGATTPSSNAPWMSSSPASVGQGSVGVGGKRQGSGSPAPGLASRWEGEQRGAASSASPLRNVSNRATPPTPPSSSRDMITKVSVLRAIESSGAGGITAARLAASFGITKGFPHTPECHRLRQVLQGLVEDMDIYKRPAKPGTVPTSMASGQVDLADTAVCFAAM